MDVQTQVREFSADFKALKTEIAKVVVGQHEIVDGVLTCLMTGGHALLEGVPGLGKTLLIRTLAEALSLKFARIQFTPDLMPADILGTNLVVEDAEGRKKFDFQPGPLFANIVLADEINRATPKTQSALLEAMQEKSITSYGTTRKLDLPFFVMGTQNPLEQEGTYPLPEAQLDRFFYKLMVQYSSREELNEIVARTTRGTPAPVRPVMDGAKILRYQALAREVVVAPHVVDFATRLVLATHPGGEFAAPLANQYLRFGGSPRGVQALILAAKIAALLDERYNVAFVDVEQAVKPALRHRVILNFEAEAEGIDPDTILQDAIKHVTREAPTPASV